MIIMMTDDDDIYNFRYRLNSSGGNAFRRLLKVESIDLDWSMQDIN